jgi:flagellar P-ring protein FlgI
MPGRVPVVPSFCEKGFSLRFIHITAVLSWLMLTSIGVSQSELKIGDLCRLKGQEENTLQGLGLVVGLKGTGDGDIKPLARALARTMQLMGGQVASDLQGKLIEKEISSAKNVALVFIKATIPPTGVQQGDKLNCTISAAMSAKSLEGGSLMLTPLLGPRADQPIVYALASGPIMLDEPRIPTTGRIAGGCKMEMTVANEFIANNSFFLIVDRPHRSLETSQKIEDAINGYQSQKNGITSPSRNGGSSSQVDLKKIARAIDQTTVEVALPPEYRERPVGWVTEILERPVLGLQNHKRVYIQEREEVVIIGEDVLIAPVGISHKNLTISSRSSQGAANGFVPVSSQDGNLLAGSGSSTKGRSTLKNLVDALNTLNVPTADMISIIKKLKEQGSLYGELVIE